MNNFENLLSKISEISGWRFFPEHEKNVRLAILRVEEQIVFITVHVIEASDIIRLATVMTPPFYGNTASMESLYRYVLNLNSTLTLGHISLHQIDDGEQFVYILPTSLDNITPEKLKEKLDYIAWETGRLKKRLQNLAKALGLKTSPTRAEKVFDFMRGRTGRSLITQEFLNEEKEQENLLPYDSPKHLP
jgi:hypothetical protein